MLALGIKKDDKILIEKTFHTFPPAYNIMCNQLKIMVIENKIKNFNEMRIRLAAQKCANEIRLNSSRRPADTKPSHAHYGRLRNKEATSMNHTTARRGQNAGNQAPRRSNTWRRDFASPPQPDAPQRVAPPRGGRVGCGSSQDPPPPPPNHPPRHHSNDRQAKFAPYYHCGFIKHFHRDCRATKETINTYRTYRKFLN